MERVEILDKSAVIGAGLMGSQIGVVLAKRSRIVFLMSRQRKTLQRAMQDARSYVEQLCQYGLLCGEDPDTVIKRIEITQRLPEAVVAGSETDPQTIDKLIRIWKNMGKIPLQVNQDVPGFLVNRLQHALIREALRLLAQGVASVEDNDLAVRLGLGPRFATAGPLEQRDLNGLRMRTAGLEE